MPTYVLCQQKETQRIALLNDVEFDQKDWSELGPRYIADTWLDAREQVDTKGMFHVPYHGWFHEEHADKFGVLGW